VARGLTAARARARSVAKPRRRKPADPARSWAKRLARARPDLVADVLEGLASIYGRPAWQRNRGPTSQLVLTILSQNSADTNAERAFESLRRAFPSSEPAESHEAGHGWGGAGLLEAPPPDWLAVEQAPLAKLVEARDRIPRPAFDEAIAKAGEPGFFARVEGSGKLGGEIGHVPQVDVQRLPVRFIGVAGAVGPIGRVGVIGHDLPWTDAALVDAVHGGMICRGQKTEN